MKRSISPFCLLLSSISAILGSGWLFSAYYTSVIAGPAAILSWIFGGLGLIIVAFVFAEICAMLPISGSSARIPQFTHGSMISFIFAWMIWLSYIALMATEVQAVIQYSSFYFPDLTHAAGGLTQKGFVAAAALLFLVGAFNVYSIRWLTRFNSFLTVLKVCIPLFIVAVILSLLFDFHHVIHPADSAFMPSGMHGVFGALSLGGILFAFNGFKQAAELAGEARHPNFAVPFAIVGSVVICMIIFVLLQTAFLTSLQPSNLVNGWSGIHLFNDNSPLAAILKQDRLAWMLPILYTGAIIAPLAAGLMYCSSAARSLYAMSKNGYVPGFFQVLSGYGNPIYAIMINFLVGMTMFAPLPGWESMVGFLTSLLAITYAIGPLCLLALRKQVPQQHRPLRLPFVKVWATLAFYICTLLAYWSGWDILSKMLFALALGFVLLFIYRKCSGHQQKLDLNWYSAIWFWPYLIGLLLVSYFGSYQGGKDMIPYPLDLVALAVLCIVVAYLAVRFRLPAEQTQSYIAELHISQNETNL